MSHIICVMVARPELRVGLLALMEREAMKTRSVRLIQSLHAESVPFEPVQQTRLAYLLFTFSDV